MSDGDETGFEKAPARYMTNGRETIDMQRDAAHVYANTVIEHLGLPAATEIVRIGRRNDVADFVFHAHCTLTAMKYSDRAGRKGPALKDHEKRAFYESMANHIENPDTCPDPRWRRADFVPYQRPLPELTFPRRG